MSAEPRRPGTRSPRKKRKYLILCTPETPTVERFRKNRHELIAELAYCKAERRGFEGGDPDRDWYEAELEVEELLRKSRPF